MAVRWGQDLRSLGVDGTTSEKKDLYEGFDLMSIALKHLGKDVVAAHKFAVQ
eukprot:gene15696-4729_t